MPCGRRATPIGTRCEPHGKAVGEEEKCRVEMSEVGKCFMTGLVVRVVGLKATRLD